MGGRSEHEHELTYLTIEEAVAVLFDSFEISQGQRWLQSYVLWAVAEKFPHLRAPQEANEIVIQALIERLTPFLQKGRGHIPQTDAAIHNEVRIAYGTLASALNARVKVAGKRTGDTLLHDLVEGMILRDFLYVVERRDRATSFIKKYFIDGKISKNTYVRAVMLDLHQEFLALLRDWGIDPAHPETLPQPADIPFCSPEFAHSMKEKFLQIIKVRTNWFHAETSFWTKER